VTSPLTWPFDSPGAISCKCSIVTESLSPANFEIMGPKHIRVTNLTFLGHVTSSIAWPIDPPYVISYWCPIGTEPLSLTVFEIFDSTGTHTDTRRKWFHIMSHAMYCIGQTITCKIMPYYYNFWHIDTQENIQAITCQFDILCKIENWEPAYQIWSGVWLKVETWSGQRYDYLWVKLGSGHSAKCQWSGD